MASYRLGYLATHSNTVRQRVMNYFAHSVIQADQVGAAAGKWIALVGNSHANTYKNVPGLAEMEGTLGMRVQDVPIGKPSGIEIDPGAEVTTALGLNVSTVKSDLMLSMPTLPASKAFDMLAPVESLLLRPGMFSLVRSGRLSKILHHSNNGSIVSTPIQFEGDHYFIDRPSWPSVSQRRYDSFDELATALKLMGMKQVA